MAYMTNRELSAAIIKRLTDGGIPRKAYRIRTTDAGHSTSVSISVRDLSVSIKKVEKLAGVYERIRRCEYSGEILMGANTYVFVQYDYEALRNAAADFLDDAKSIIDAGADYPHLLYKGYGLEVTYIFVAPGSFENVLRIDSEDGERIRYAACDRLSLAEGLAIADAYKRRNAA